MLNLLPHVAQHMWQEHRKSKRALREGKNAFFGFVAYNLEDSVGILN